MELPLVLSDSVLVGRADLASLLQRTPSPVLENRSCLDAIVMGAEGLVAGLNVIQCLFLHLAGLGALGDRAGSRMVYPSRLIDGSLIK